VDHTLPRMDLDGTARAFEALALAKRVVEEYFIFTYVNSNGWRPGQIAIKGRRLRVARVVPVKMKLRRGGE